MSWNIDAAHSHIQFSVRHMMVSRVRGQFDSWTGTVNVDEDNPENSSVTIQIDANSINTREKDRDAHLRSADFLDAENHPHLTFESTDVEKIDDKRYKVTGDLTIRGVTHPVTLDVVHEGTVKSPLGPYQTAGFNAETKINRKKWGLEWNAPIETGGVVVGEEVQISIELELMQEIEETSAEAVAAG